MKKIFLLLSILCVYCQLSAIGIKEKIRETPITGFPFECTKTSPWGKPGYELSGSELGNLPIYTYIDLGLTQRTKYENVARIFRRFDSMSNSYELLALSIGNSDPNKQLLAVFSGEGEVVDYIETAVYFITTERMYVKQWRINANQEIIVTWLKVDTPAPISAFSNFSHVRAQRIDTYYKVNSEGKFQELKQVKYHPQTYTRDYLTDKTKNLWEGNEVLMK